MNQPEREGAQPGFEHEDKILRPSILIWRSFIRDRAAVIGGIMVFVILFIALLCPFLAPRDPLAMQTKDRMQSPSAVYWMGTDNFGRDQTSRVMYGMRTSMIVSFGSIAIAVFVGIALGIISGYYGGWVDTMIMRIIDVFYAFPVIFLALAVVAMFRPNLTNLIFTIGFIYSIRIARVIRGSVLSVKETDYIEAIRSAGARNFSIMVFYILPNILSSAIVQSTYFLATAIQVEAGLSFLGLGTQPPMASLGLMLNESRRYLEIAPWLSIMPGLAIVFAVLAFNLMGDGLRNALDPRLSRR